MDLLRYLAFSFTRSVAWLLAMGWARRRPPQPSNVVALDGRPLGPVIKRGGGPSALRRLWLAVRLAVELTGWLSWSAVALVLLLR